jgi:hypothetical protein
MIRKITFEEVNNPSSPWPQGFRPDLRECPLTHKRCQRNCGDICKTAINK